MIFNFLFGTFYSTGLSCFCFSTFPPNTWDIKQSVAIVGFWNIFMVPFGMLWNQVNNKLLKASGIKIALTNQIFINKKYMMLDLLFNHIVYQSIFVFSFYRYLHEFFPNYKIFASNEEKNKEKNMEQSNNIVKEIVIFRAKLSLFSIIFDLWIPTQGQTRGIKMMKVKNLGVQTFWHLYLFHK